jgi:HK97 family phage prohead protease
VKKQTERRFVKCEFRVSAPEEPSKISGYAAVFDSPSENLGWYQEVREEIDPHAFDTVLASNPDVRGFFNHDPNLVLGRTTAGTLRLSVDARGLAYEIDPPETQFAKDLMVSMRRKDITGSSFAFSCKRDQWTDNPDGSVTRRILEFDELFDVSPVTFPAYPASSSEARKLPSSMPAEMRKRFEKRADANENGCECSCEECQADDCENCSDPECDDPNCLANQERSSGKGQQVPEAGKEGDENRRMQIRVALNL